jgi:hypothetical protein
MKTLGIAILLVVSGLAAPSAGQDLTHDELLEVLDIHAWRIPLPKDPKYNWGVDLVDAKPRSVITSGASDWMHPTDRALVTFRADGDDRYRFTFKQRGGMSSGLMAITPCAGTDSAPGPCGHQYSVEWHAQPIRVDDGKQYVLADVESAFGEGRKKQLVLVLRRYRP